MACLLGQEEELLPPEEAFNLSAWMENDALVAEYQIAPGYYMYRERFDFQIEASDTAARFDVARIPRGKIKSDEFFGEMEVYRNRVRILLPLIFENVPANSLQVKAIGQGCADIGVCYPPLKQTLAVDVASSARITPTAWAGWVVSHLKLRGRTWPLYRPCWVRQAPAWKAIRSRC